MRSPTEQAERCLQQLILYLKGTKNMSFWLPYTQVGTSMAKILNNAPQDELEDTEHLMEIFCDSDWAGSLYRKSTTSVVVLLNSLVVLSYSRTQKAVALSSCEAEVLSLTSGSSEAMLLKEVWQFMVGKRHSISLEARSDSSSGRQWLQRSGIGRLKHIDVRLCWLQDAIRSKVLKALPVPTQTNIADLNTKKLTAMRRKFLLSFMGAIRISEDNTILERIGEEEQTTYFMEQQWKNQVRQVTRWTKNKSSRLFAQCVMMMQAMNLKGCMEHSSDEVVEQDNSQQFYLTLLVLVLVALCNWVHNNWHALVARFGPRGRKRRHDERDEEEPEPETTRRVVVGNDNIEPGASSSDGPGRPAAEIEPQPPLFPPMPLEPPGKWEPWSPEWFTYWMLGRVERRIERRAGRMSEEEKKKYWKRREILRSTLLSLRRTLERLQD